LSDHSTAKADQSGRGHIATTSNRTTKGDVIKIGTTDAVVQENNEGPMVFGESAMTSKKRRYDCQQNNRSEILHAPMVLSEIDTIAKAKLTAPKSEGEPGQGG
jgi:hypothetical protein